MKEKCIKKNYRKKTTEARYNLSDRIKIKIKWTNGQREKQKENEIEGKKRRGALLIMPWGKYC